MWTKHSKYNMLAERPAKLDRTVCFTGFSAATDTRKSRRSTYTPTSLQACQQTHTHTQSGSQSARCTIECGAQLSSPQREWEWERGTDQDVRLLLFFMLQKGDFTTVRALPERGCLILHTWKSCKSSAQRHCRTRGVSIYKVSVGQTGP